MRTFGAWTLVLATASCFPSYVFPGDVDGGATEGGALVDVGGPDVSVPSTDASSDAVDVAPPPPDSAIDAGADTNGPAVSLQGCVLLLHMDEPAWSGVGSVKDSSGKANHGNPIGNATTTTTGRFGGAAFLDGSGWIAVPDSVSLHATTAVTYAAWVRPTGLTDGTASPGIISKRRGFNDNVAYTLFLWTSNEAWVDVQGTRFASDSVFANDTWAHVAVVYDGNAADTARRVKLYVNGKLDKPSSADPTLAPNTEDILLGNLPGGGNTFTGKLDEIVIWTRALSDAEIAALASATAPL